VGTSRELELVHCSTFRRNKTFERLQGCTCHSDERHAKDNKSAESSGEPLTRRSSVTVSVASWELPSGLPQPLTQPEAGIPDVRILSVIGTKAGWIIRNCNSCSGRTVISLPRIRAVTAVLSDPPLAAPCALLESGCTVKPTTRGPSGAFNVMRVSAIVRNPGPTRCPAGLASRTVPSTGAPAGTSMYPLAITSVGGVIVDNAADTGLQEDVGPSVKGPRQGCRMRPKLNSFLLGPRNYHQLRSSPPPHKQRGLQLYSPVNKQRRLRWRTTLAFTSVGLLLRFSIR
jgi:hypothetical protein